jgi:serine/threonine-protein kinase
MGEVWKAEDTRLGRVVAIKVLPQEIVADEEAVARLRREARMAAQLNHPNIATIHAFEECDGLHRHGVRRGRALESDSRDFRNATCAGSAAASRKRWRRRMRGVIHREQADNILCLPIA